MRARLSLHWRFIGVNEMKYHSLSVPCTSSRKVNNMNPLITDTKQKYIKKVINKFNWNT